MMPARYVPLSQQTITVDGATPVASTPYPEGATLLLIGGSDFIFTIDQDVDESNSIFVTAYQPILTTVGKGGYISAAQAALTTGPVIAAASLVRVMEVRIS